MNMMDVLVEMWRSESRHDNRKQVRDVIGTLALISEQNLESTFLYRGESECHERVSSGLYRHFYELDDESFDIMEAQDRQLKIARPYAKDENDPDRILAQIQHRGGKTNLIDFTSDLNIALFFACNYSPDKDGRIIFFENRQWYDYCIRRAIQPSNMADAQKSYFVSSNQGYIRNEDITVFKIPSELKAGILQHLQNVYGIEPPTVYNDISGFIRDQDQFSDFRADIFAGQKYFCADDWAKAIDFYTKALQNPTVIFLSREGTVYANVYRQRGIANYYVDNRNAALHDLQIFDSHGGDWKEKPEIPEEIKNWFDKAKRIEEERQKESQTVKDTENTRENHCIWIEAQDSDGNPVDGARFKLLSEDGYESSQRIQNKRVQVTIPGECHGSKCLFWFNMAGYCGVNPVQVQLGDSFMETLKPSERNSNAPEVTIRVTYETPEAT